MIEQFNTTSKIEMNVSKGAKLVLHNELPFDKAFVQAENIMYRRKLNNRSSRKSKVLDSIVETLNAKTEETKDHSDRMSELAVQTMQKLGMVRASEIEDMELLCRVHDIGKITVDDNILKKPGPLTDAEYELIKRHSEAGYKIIRNITDSDNVCNGVLLHHERWDGTGYPQGLKGDAIPIFARIITVVDAYDAMTNDRIYSVKMTHEEALKELQRCTGTQFDPKVVQAFLDIFH
jgi:HD-GYP domain-containing protein (c-di-GMP phosphodiesterase class II)